MPKNDGMLSMKEAAKATGLSQSVLRIWELRYGWPRPRRQANGYRVYAPHEVDQLKRVGELVRSGVSVSTVIMDGEPVFPSTRPAAARPQFRLAAAVAQPIGGEGKALRAELQEAFLRLDHGRILTCLAEAQRLPASDRLLAAVVPVIAALTEMPASPGCDRVQDMVETMLGADAIAAISRELAARIQPKGAAGV